MNESKMKNAKIIEYHDRDNLVWLIFKILLFNNFIHDVYTSDFNIADNGTSSIITSKCLLTVTILGLILIIFKENRSKYC